jgi:hypothetical protein
MPAGLEPYGLIPADWPMGRCGPVTRLPVQRMLSADDCANEDTAQRHRSGGYRDARAGPCGDGAGRGSGALSRSRSASVGDALVIGDARWGR